MNIKDSIKIILSDRGYLTGLIVMLLAATAIIIIGATHIRPSELQVPVRYSSFGITNFYRDRWYYLLNFIVYALFVGVSHSLISLKLYKAKGRDLAVSFVWLSVIVLIISAFLIFAMLRVTALSQ